MGFRHINSQHDLQTYLIWWPKNNLHERLYLRIVRRKVQCEVQCKSVHFLEETPPLLRVILPATPTLQTLCSDTYCKPDSLLIIVFGKIPYPPTLNFCITGLQVWAPLTFQALGQALSSFACFWRTQLKIKIFILLGLSVGLFSIYA